MKRVSALDLRKHVGQLLDEAAAGERIVIERGGQPLCALVPLRDLEEVEPRRKLRRQLHAIDELQRLARQHPFPPGFDAVEVIREGRRERDEQIMRAVNDARSKRRDMTSFQGQRAIVVDASVAVDFVAGIDEWPARWRNWRSSDAQLLAPPQFRLEVANACLKGSRREASALVALRLQLLFESGVDLVDRGLHALIETVELAERHGLTVYDAAYLQLALDCEAEIATLDQALGRAAAAEGLMVHR